MLTVDTEKHVYTWNGFRVPGVSEIIDSEIPFESFVEAGVLEKCRWRGEYFHKVVELYETNNLEEYLPEFEPLLDGWKRFKDDLKFTVDLGRLEKPLYSKLYGYAGRPDVPTVEGFLIDIKPPANSKRYDLQTAAYVQLLAEDEFKVMSRMIYHYEEGNYFLTKPKRTQREDFNVFQSMLNVYNWKKNN